MGSSEVFLQEDLIGREEIQLEYLRSGGVKGNLCPTLSGQHGGKERGS